MRILAAIAVAIASISLAGCANVSTSRLVFKTPTETLEIELPKEMVAKDADVKVDFRKGEITLKASHITTKNQGTIAAQGERESGNLEKVNKITGKVVEGAVTGIMKGVVP